MGSADCHAYKHPARLLHTQFMHHVLSLERAYSTGRHEATITAYGNQPHLP